MKNLLVLRHAKSSWAHPELADFDRPLNERGLQAAPFMGRVVAEAGLSPDVIISSPAIRAKTTAELVKKGGQLTAAISFDDRIYEASPQSLLQIGSTIEPTVESAMFVGHNPGIEAFIKLLTGVYEPMPTAALAIIDLEIKEWRDIAVRSGDLIRVIRPKDRLRSLGTSG